MGGTFDRGGTNPPATATVSSFALDRFEVTVGRFRKFLDAYPGSAPKEGDGANPYLQGSGWNPLWRLPPDQYGFETAFQGCSTTWTEKPTGESENLPMSCLDWYMAFAFCAWDGGWLPTEAEWYYAAAGGDVQRAYPWSNPPSSTTVGPDDAVFDCAASPPCSLLPVGSKSPAGDGYFHQADMGGSVAEWTLDHASAGGSYPVPCDDCANLDATFPARILRGGSWQSYPSELANASRPTQDPTDASDEGGPGVRCARAYP
jgi:formylglycine-generating enzyme required for sulfatase activity